MGIPLHSLVAGTAIFNKVNFFPCGLQNIPFKWSFEWREVKLIITSSHKKEVNPLVSFTINSPRLEALSAFDANTEQCHANLLQNTAACL